MEKLTNVVVESGTMGKSGVSQYGPWQAWTVYLQGSEVKFSYFERDNIVPFAGMQVALLEYEVEQKGEYTNYTIKKLVPVQLGDPASVPKIPQVLPMSNLVVRPNPVVRSSLPKPGVSSGLSAAEKNKRFTMCTAYAKDIMVELIRTDGCDSPYRHAKLSKIIGAVIKARNALLAETDIGAAETSQNPVMVTKLQPEDTAGGTSITEVPPIVSEEAIKEFSEKAITPAMVKLANDALPGTTSDQPGNSVPNDDVPF
jgi:hypothetical protein